MVTLTLVTILSGALVAGNDAGRAYNTFPKMNDEWFPSNYFGEVPDNNDNDNDDAVATHHRPHPSTSTAWPNLSSIFRNFYENTATVQFNHRFCGITTAMSGTAVSLYGLYRIYPSLQSLLSIGHSVTPTPNQLGKVVFPLSSSLSSSTLILLPYVRTGLLAIGLAVTGQFTLGVTTLMTYVPISLAALHQIGSVVVLTSAIYLFHTSRTILRTLPTTTATVATKTISNAATSTGIPITAAATVTKYSVLSNPLLSRQLSTIAKDKPY
jgi:cytochrome c oxidase assembly protein subunit 15